MPSVSSRIQLKGEGELEKMFNNLPRRLQVKVIRPGLRAGAKVVKIFCTHEAQAALSETPQPPPHVADLFKIKAMKRDRSAKARIGFIVITGTRAALGLKPDDGYYPAHIEYGHFTRPSKSIEEDTVFGPVSFSHTGARSEHHRHVPANPFMKRALEAARGPAHVAMKKEMAARLKTLAGVGDDVTDADFFGEGEEVG